MAGLSVDFTIPIALLASAIVGVLIVRQLTLYGARRARARTAKLLAEHMPAEGGPDGIEEDGGASQVG